MNLDKIFKMRNFEVNFQKKSYAQIKSKIVD